MGSGGHAAAGSRSSMQGVSVQPKAVGMEQQTMKFRAEAAADMAGRIPGVGTVLQVGGAVVVE